MDDGCAGLIARSFECKKGHGQGCCLRGQASASQNPKFEDRNSKQIRKSKLESRLVNGSQAIQDS